jgi:phosphomannomutase
MLSFIDPGVVKPFSVVLDAGSGMGGLVAPKLFARLPCRTTELCFEIDGTFPNHEANPLKADTLEALQRRVRQGGYDFGVAFDGDADRVGFVDEKGEIVPMDMITALIAQSLLRENRGSAIFYDLRSSWAVKEVIQENGGRPMMSRVGHAFIKQQMREADAVFAGELSGHYYFKHNYYTESSSLAVIHVANLVSQAGKPLSELIRPIQRYVASGEINSEVHDAPGILDALLKKYASGKVIKLDGVSVEFDDWWFNVRTSNTEPLMRLNLEAKTRAKMEQMRDEVLAIIRG